MKYLICLLLGHKHIFKHWDIYFKFDVVTDGDKAIKRIDIGHRTCIRCSKLITYINPVLGEK